MSIRLMVVLMLTSQYSVLCTLSILLVLMAPPYQEEREQYTRRSKFILVPLHLLHVWVVIIAFVTNYGGFCTD